MAVVAAFGLLGTAPAAAAPAVTVPVLVIKADHLEGDHDVPFNIAHFGPGDTVPVSVVVRNEANHAAQVTYDSTDLSRSDLAEYVLVTIKRDDVVLATGQADSAKLSGATFEVAPYASARLDLELSMPGQQGNEAQGKALEATFRFNVEGGPAKTATPTSTPPGTSTGTSGVTETVRTGRPADATDQQQVAHQQSPTKDILPPTGTSLGAFHLLVWSALGALAVLLVVIALAARVDRVRR